MLHFTTFCYHDGQLGLVVWPTGHILQSPDRKKAINHFTKHDMLAVQPVTFVARDKELATIGARAAICLV